MASACALLLIASCAAPKTQSLEPGPTPARPARPAPSLEVGPAEAQPAPGSSSLPLATVAGDPIEASDFFAHLLHRESRLVYDTLDRMVTARLALLEAGRLGVRLDPSQVDSRMAQDRARMEELLQGRGTEVERYLAEELGLDPGRYFELMRDETVQQLLSERVMRAWTLGQERCELRAIVTATRDEMQVVQDRLAAGEDFPALAGELSLDPSGAAGGLLPPVIRSELSPLSRLSFETELGSLGGPIEQDGHWVLIRPEVRPVPISGEWAQIGEQVEEDLEAHPIADPEYWQWRAAMARRYQIDVTGLLKLAGEPRAADGP